MLMHARHPDGATRLRSRHRSGGLVVALIAIVTALVVVYLLMSREEGSGSSAKTGVAEVGTTTASQTTTRDVRDEVVSRLHRIFQVRDQAITSRNASLLNEIYTVDCPCLEGDRRLIENLRRDQLMWRGVSISLDIRGTERLSDRLWTVNAVITTSPFEIVKESGEVVKRIPGGQELSRFALARVDGEEWLLGKASVVEARG
jgi:hypothetical protein